MAGKPSVALQSVADRTERMRLLASAMRYVDVGRPIPDDLRYKLSAHDRELVEEYRQTCLEDIDVRR